MTTQVCMTYLFIISYSSYHIDRDESTSIKAIPESIVSKCSQFQSLASSF